jgi:hypothetical protein
MLIVYRFLGTGYENILVGADEITESISGGSSSKATAECWEGDNSEKERGEGEMGVNSRKRGFVGVAVEG